MALLAASVELATAMGRPAEGRALGAAALQRLPDGPPEPALGRPLAAALRLEVDAAEQARVRRDEPAEQAALVAGRDMAARIEGLTQASPLAGDPPGAPQMVERLEASRAGAAAELTRLEGRTDADAW